METLKLDYLVLTTFLYILFGIYGYKISKRSNNISYKNYWYLVFLPVLSYSFIEGFRYGRGVDYIFYMKRYISFASTYLDTSTYFDWFNYSLDFFGIPFYFAFVIYSLVLISCVFFFLKEYIEVAQYSFVLFLCATLFYSESFISQFFALSFVFVAIKYVLNDDWLRFSVFSILAILFHNSCIVVLLMTVVLKLYNKPFSIYWTVPFYTFASFLFDMKNISILTPLFEKINLGGNNHFQSYVENADIWFSKDAVNSIYEQSFVTKTANFLFDVSILISGRALIDNYKNVDKKKSLVLFYNLFALGAILFQAFFHIELMRRIAIEMYLFWFIVVSYILYYYKLKRKPSLIFKIMTLIIVLYAISIGFKYIFLSQDSLFVWDTNFF